MAEITLTAADLKERYPEFAAVSDTYIETVLAEAVLDVGEDWIATTRVPAILALTAHKLNVEGEPGRTKSGGEGSPTGEVKKITVGDVSTEFSTTRAVSSSGYTGYSFYSSSSYGMTFWRYLKRSNPGIITV